MLKKFNQYINEHNLCSPSDIILIAISGGADSVVLFELFKLSGYNIALAHCNFQLRNKESDDDELFIKELAKQNNVKLHSISFDTNKYASENKVSIEMAARDLRYNWFNELIDQYNYTKIATGHHLNDSIETLFLNIARGTGYQGLKGIPNKNNKTIRPLLFATRNDIEQYAQNDELKYRTDSSNESTKYLRNIVRHNIIPAFKELNPAFEQVMFKNLNHLTESTKVLDSYFGNYQAKLLKLVDGKIEIPFDAILEKSPVKIHLFQLIQQFGFNRDAIDKIIEAFDKEPGKIFKTNTHELLIDRNSIVITELKESTNSSYIINDINSFGKLPISLKAKNILAEDFKLIKKPNLACLDSEKLSFPLTLRKWKHGDSFHPLGMKNKKKLSDFFIDEKLNRISKNEVWILESKNEIIWIVNMRIDDRYKVTSLTKRVLTIEFFG